jgi:hypothetical protein
VQGGSMSFVVAQGIDTTSYTEASLLVRVHSGTTIGDAATVSVAVVPYAPTHEDPTKNGNFIGSSIATATVTSSDSAPTLLKADFSSNPGMQVLVGVAAVQDSNSSETIVAVLSAELVMKY